MDKGGLPRAYTGLPVTPSHMTVSSRLDSVIFLSYTNKRTPSAIRIHITQLLHIKTTEAITHQSTKNSIGHCFLCLVTLTFDPLTPK